MLKVYYQVKCFFITKKPEYFHSFDIGIFDTMEKAQNAVELVKEKSGFCQHKNDIKIKKRLMLFTPKLINKIFWEDGFISYEY